MRKTVQFTFLFLQTFLVKHKKQIVIGSIIGFFSTLLLLQIYPLYLEFFGRKSYKIGIVGKYNQSNLPLSIQNQISLGLTFLSPKGEATPSAAFSWEIRENGKIYLLHLRNDLSWHNGQRFTTKDINYKLNGATFTPLDDYTLQVSLQDVYVPLLVLLSQPLFKSNLIGLGMYKAEKVTFSEDTISELKLQPQYKTLPSLTYIFYPNTHEAILAFKLGKMNILQNVSDIEDLNAWKNIKITQNTLYDRFVGVILNLRDKLFKEKEIRQALSYAIPKFEGLEKVHTPISPLSWAYSQKIRLYNFDPEAAQKILSKTPISSSSSQLVLSTFAPLLGKAQIIADSLNKIGLNVKVKVENSIPSDYQMFLLTQIIPSDPDQYQFWQSTQEATNLSHYSSPKIDKLLEDGRKTLDVESRKKIYADFQRYLVDDAPVIFLYYPKVYTVERK